MNIGHQSSFLKPLPEQKNLCRLAGYKPCPRIKASNGLLSFERSRRRFRVGRTKAAALAGTAQTRVSRCDTLSAGLVFDWRSPFRHFPVCSVRPTPEVCDAVIVRTTNEGDAAISRHCNPKLQPFVGLAIISKMLRLSQPVCRKTAVIRNLVQSGQEVLEIARKRCKFVVIES